MPEFEPAYVATHAQGKLRVKAEAARRLLRECTLCPHQCRVDRTAGQTGICRTAEHAVVASFNPHFGEEAPLVGRRGSGTIFFAHCNLLCLFCQNYDISHEGHGRRLSAEELAGIMLFLQKQGCHNINFVTPTHVVPQILEALVLAAAQGLRVPLVYNSGGYDRVESLRLLEGVFDIYMPDFKFWDAAVAGRACQAGDYPEVARHALKEMHRQVGDLVVASNGLATRGVLIRHLVLPENMAGTREVMRFIAREISADSYVNIMPQYRPCGRAHEIAELSRRPTPAEFDAALRVAAEEGISRLDKPHRKFVIF
jgi:putative pyruvate formate lyase activating enzyme